MTHHNEKNTRLGRQLLRRVFAYFEILLPSRQAVNKAPESARNGGDAHERYKHNVVITHRSCGFVAECNKKVAVTLVFAS